MYKQYIKQAVQMLRENTLVSIISISGTALAIAMVLVMVLVFQIKPTAVVIPPGLGLCMSGVRKSVRNPPEDRIVIVEACPARS